MTIKKAPPSKQQVAFSVLTVEKAAGDETADMVISGWATTPSPDRTGDIVEPAGITFANPVPLLWQHDRSAPVGTVVFDKPTNKGMRFTATLPYVAELGTLKSRVDEARQSIKYNMIKAVSIGFRPTEYSWMDDGGVRYLESEVYELSLVTIPAQAEAIIDTIKRFDAPMRANAAKSAEPSGKTYRPGVKLKQEPNNRQPHFISVTPK